MERTLIERLEDLAIGYEIAAEGEKLIADAAPLLRDQPKVDPFSVESRRFYQGIDARKKARDWTADAATLREAIKIISDTP